MGGRTQMQAITLFVQQQNGSRYVRILRFNAIHDASQCMRQRRAARDVGQGRIDRGQQFLLRIWSRVAGRGIQCHCGPNISWSMFLDGSKCFYSLLHQNIFSSFGCTGGEAGFL